MTISVPTEKGKTMREKLIELLKSGGVRDFPFNAALADHLIANGVTVQKWIPVTERLPEKYGKYLCRYVFNESAEYPHLEVISYYPTMTRFQGEGSCGMRVTHWMPLPEAPKGE
jgi:hypothetical protein